MHVASVGAVALPRPHHSSNELRAYSLGDDGSGRVARGAAHVSPRLLVALRAAAVFGGHAAAGDGAAADARLRGRGRLRRPRGAALSARGLAAAAGAIAAARGLCGVEGGCKEGG